MPDDGCRQEECISDPNQAGYGDCGGYLYECADGVWDRIGYCEPQPLAVSGTWTLEQAVATASDNCPEIVVPGARETCMSASELIVSSSEDLEISGEVEIDEGFQTSSVRFEAADRAWLVSGLPREASIHYDLTFHWDGSISGSARAEIELDDSSVCNVEVSISGQHDSDLCEG